MPQEPTPESDGYANQLAAIYALAQQLIFERVTAILRRTFPDLASQQVARIQIRRVTNDIVSRLVYQTNPLVQKMITAAVSEGEKAADGAIAAAGGPPPPPGSSLERLFDDTPFDLSMPHSERAAQAIRDDITSELQDVRFRLTRLPDDIYKAIAPHGGIGQVLDNGFTPAHAQAVAWRVFVSKGITGFTDKAGRNWSLSAYTEMAVRTASLRAFNASHLARMTAVGIKYVTVTDDGHPCPLCLPWQNRVLAISPDGLGTPTIADAVAAGLHHPNCRHTWVAVIPGVTKLPPVQEWTPEHAAAYNATQKQRAIERDIRKNKLVAQHALDTDVKTDALADVRRQQANLRAHIAEHGLKRQSRREQPDLSNGRIKLPTPQ